MILHTSSAPYNWVLVTNSNPAQSDYIRKPAVIAGFLVYCNRVSGILNCLYPWPPWNFHTAVFKYDKAGQYK